VPKVGDNNLIYQKRFQFVRSQLLADELLSPDVGASINSFLRSVEIRVGAGKFCWGIGKKHAGRALIADGERMLRPD
jgi:hypothetical protein